MMNDPRGEPIAKAIYMTHWKPTDPDSGRPGAPLWDDASKAVRQWVIAQAKSALAVIDAAAPVRHVNGDNPHGW